MQRYCLFKEFQIQRAENERTFNKHKEELQEAKALVLKGENEMMKMKKLVGEKVNVGEFEIVKQKLENLADKKEFDKFKKAILPKIDGFN